MDSSTKHPAPSSNADTVKTLPDDPPWSPDRIPAAIVAQRRVIRAGGVGSPIRRSPRLSCLLPPRPPIESHDTRDLDESSDNESESVYDVALHLSRDETPENDDLPPDEPSSVLAGRIMRAHDNPSPPPQELAHPGMDYVPGKDGQFPLPSVPVPPSPFRSINLLERLNQFSNPLFNPVHNLGTPPPSVPQDISGSSPRIFTSPESAPASITSMTMKSAQHEDLASASIIPPSFAQCTVGEVPLGSSQHSVPTSGSLEPGVPTSPSTRVVDPPLNLAVVSTSRSPRPCSMRRHDSSPLPPDSRTPLFPPSYKNNIVTQDGEEIPSVDNNIQPHSQGEQENRSTKEVDADLLPGLRSLSPASTEALTGPRLPTKPASSVNQLVLPSDSIRIESQPRTPPRTPAPSVTHPDFSRTSVLRPIIAPTPVRAKTPWKINSPSKSSLEVDEVCRTPAQRVPLETALAGGISSVQRAAQLSTGPDQSRPERILTVKAPVFARPALDDPSRSPAKRIPIMDAVASPARGHQTQCSPRLEFRARSASVEPRALRTTLARSRSVELSTTDNQGKSKESPSPVVLTFPRAGTKLPFPLVPNQKSGSTLPTPIPEEDENVEARNIRADTLLSKPTQARTISQLRQPSTNSRIPRIGDKPYARPLKNGRITPKTPSDNSVRAPEAPPFQTAKKNRRPGTGHAGTSTQATNNKHSAGSLKRKWDAEALTPPNPLIIRQVIPGILGEKYAPKPTNPPSQVQAPTESRQLKAAQPLKFRKVVDGMLSARYAPAKTNHPQMELLGSTSHSPSPLSELSPSSEDGSSDEKPPAAHSPQCIKSKTLEDSRMNDKVSVVETNADSHTPGPSRHYQDTDGDKIASRPRRTSRARKPAQQQYVLDVFSANTSARPVPARRKLPPRTEADHFMGMSANALKALTTSNTTKNQQTVAVLETEVIRKEGLRPESPTVKARTILQKQRDERDVRRRERAQRKAKMSEEGSKGRDTEEQSELDDGASLGTREDHDDCDVPQKHHRGPGDEEDYETPERSGRGYEPLRLEGVDRKSKPVKQVKWHRGLSTAAYLDELDPRPKSMAKDVIVRGCLAPTSKNLPLDSLGNLVDRDSRPSPELVMEHIVVKKYLYDNDVEPEPVPPKTTRSRSKKNKS